MTRYFFHATEVAHAQITGLFDFVWPTATAMWNLRWQVAGYLGVLPDSTDAQLKARFTEGAGIHGANLRRACVEHSWDEQKQIFARILLTNAIAVYEAWIEDVLDDMSKNTKAIQKSLQYPDDVGIRGVRSAISELTVTESALLKSSFYTALCAKRHYSLANLNALMRCFRFFKELRNCDIHGGSEADQRLVDAYIAFSPVANCAALGLTEVPIHHVPILGNRALSSLRGVVGFSGILLRIMATLDAELSRSNHAERGFERKWKRTHLQKIQLPKEIVRRGSKVKRLVFAAGFPKPKHPENIADWLKNSGLAAF